MAQLRLTSKGLLLLILILSFVAFGLGFGVWQLAGPKTFNPTASDAAGDNGGQGCYSLPPLPCDCALGCDGNKMTCSDNNKDGKCGNGGTDPCDDFTIEQCCDGTSIRNYKNNACTKNGGKCPSESSPECKGSLNQQCSCRLYDGCGVDCSFPAWVDKAVQDEANQNSCSKKMAYCIRDAIGNTTIKIEDGGACWDKRNICKNPAAESPCDVPVTNVCDGGSLTTPTNSADYKVGDVVQVKGYAFDTDGIDKTKVVVKVDGAVVGNANVVDHACASVSADSICTAAAGKPAVDFTYNYTVTTAGVHTFDVTWVDTKGLGGASCQGNRNITANIQGNPSWEISKTGSSICIDETAGAQKARVDYTIVVKNVGSLAGQLSGLLDTLDSKVQDSFVQMGTVTPDGLLSGGKLSWDVSGAMGQFGVNEQKTFKYSLEVPQSAFGTYTNTVKATPDSGDAFQAIEVTVASCNAPETGIFDSAISKVVLGIILIGVSAAYLYSDSFSINFLGKGKDKKKEFENRVAGN